MKNKKLSQEIADKVQGSTLKKEATPERTDKPEQAKYKARAGWGGMDSYAYAVKNVIDESRHLRGSSRSFLGKDRKVLDPKAHTDREMLHKKKK